MVRLVVAILMALAGALVALPNPVASQIDLSGEWNITLTGDVNTFKPCETSVEQIGVALTFVVSCNQPIGSGTLTGSIDPDGGDFDVSGILSGIVGGFLFEFTGKTAPDGSSFQGPWTISSVPAFGQFSGQRKEVPTPTPTATPTDTPTPTPTPTPTGTPVPPTPIGGFGILPDVGGPDSTGGNGGMLGDIAAAVSAGAVAAAGAAWYAKRRWSR